MSVPTLDKYNFKKLDIKEPSDGDGGVPRSWVNQTQFESLGRNVSFVLDNATLLYGLGDFKGKDGKRDLKFSIKISLEGQDEFVKAVRALEDYVAGYIAKNSDTWFRTQKKLSKETVKDRLVSRLKIGEVNKKGEQVSDHFVVQVKYYNNQFGSTFMHAETGEQIQFNIDNCWKAIPKDTKGLFRMYVGSIWYRNKGKEWGIKFVLTDASVIPPEYVGGSGPSLPPLPGFKGTAVQVDASEAVASDNEYNIDNDDVDTDSGSDSDAGQEDDDGDADPDSSSSESEDEAPPPPPKKKTTKAPAKAKAKPTGGKAPAKPRKTKTK